MGRDLVGVALLMIWDNAYAQLTPRPNPSNNQLLGLRTCFDVRLAVCVVGGE